ncbi:MAG: adenylate/guanylate cyclase domain-containing protein [Bacteroidales bacterium]|nr:adenylate/guanylate cyclase domain-containing protein [Bacteroidales bacterium]
MNSTQKQELKANIQGALISGIITAIFMYFVYYQGMLSVWAGLFIGFTIFMAMVLYRKLILIKLARRTNLFLLLIFNTIFHVIIILLIAWIGVVLFYMGGNFGILFKDFNLLTSIESQIGLLFGLTLSIIFNFLYIIDTLIGKNVLGKLFIGKYRKPFEVERVFMFLDIKSSTAIAEKIGHIKFLSLVNDFFFDILDPINQTKGEIYKYVGDEAIATWKIKHAINQANCIECFFLIKEKIKSRSDYYLNKYGIVPEFKAGIHVGKVITGELGYTKREIAYMGDVLNTTARIEEACKTYNHDFLISEEILKQISVKNNFRLEEIGGVKLRGKENEMRLFGVNRK